MGGSCIWSAEAKGEQKSTVALIIETFRHIEVVWPKQSNE